MIRTAVAALSLFLIACSFVSAEEKIKTLIIDGQNNHRVWPQTSSMMKGYLEETGLFTVTIATTAPKGTDADFHPEFANYDVVVTNYNGAPWPEKTQADFDNFVKNGGGFVVVHAADNSFGDWKQYNRMIGVGGWNGRNEKSGPFVYFKDGKIVRDDAKGSGGHHGRQHPFSIIVRDDSHPVTKGMPGEWMHANDELYDTLRGPAEGMNVLATAYSDTKTGGTGRHEPMMMTIEYGDGRVFHTPMGHGVDSQECVGFITTLVRGAEWVATGKVTTKIPADFPTADAVSRRTAAKKGE